MNDNGRTNKVLDSLRNLRRDLSLHDFPISAATVTEAIVELERLREQVADVMRMTDAVRDMARKRNLHGATILDFMVCWNEQYEANSNRLNLMLRDTGYGQGQIDAYVAQCEELENCWVTVANLRAQLEMCKVMAETRSAEEFEQKRINPTASDNPLLSDAYAAVCDVVFLALLWKAEAKEADKAVAEGVVTQPYSGLKLLEQQLDACERLAQVVDAQEFDSVRKQITQEHPAWSLALDAVCHSVEARLKAEADARVFADCKAAVQLDAAWLRDAAAQKECAQQTELENLRLMFAGVKADKRMRGHFECKRIEYGWCPDEKRMGYFVDKEWAGGRIEDAWLMLGKKVKR